jgi:hypothetical protein
MASFTSSHVEKKKDSMPIVLRGIGVAISRCNDRGATNRFIIVNKKKNTKEKNNKPGVGLVGLWAHY